MTTRALSPLTHDAAEPRCPERTADSLTTQRLAEVTCTTCLRNMVLALLRPASPEEVREAAVVHMAVEDPVTLIADDVRCPIHGIPDCSPLLNGCSIPSTIAGRIHAVVERTRAADAFKATEPHAYGVEVLWNPGTSFEDWRIETEDTSVRETLDAAARALGEMTQFGGYSPEQVRLVALTVVPTPDLSATR